MFQFIQPAILALIGLMLAIYGLIHSVVHFPGALAFAVLWESLPALGTVAIFLLGVLAVIAGILLLIGGLRRFGRRWHRLRHVLRSGREIDLLDTERERGRRVRRAQGRR